MWWSSRPARRQRRRSRPDVASAQLPESSSVERSVGRLDRDGPGAVAGGDVSAGVHEAGPGRREDLGGALARVALADAAEVDSHAAVEPDDAVLHPNPRGCRSRRGRALRRRGKELERAVVAGGEERVVDGDVEAAAGALLRSERELDDAQEVGAGGERARRVEPR